ncbi:hypothetical protein G9A89_001861 [Geosiphon pyriformis]|nr:hypothetical protein G9A89_001861 [Geosiphon pyriformis]
MTKGQLQVLVENKPFLVFHIYLVEARHLKDEDSVGKSDPYVELWVQKGYKQKTSTKKGTITPQWHEKLTFEVNDDHYLHLKVLDEDVGDDDKIGATKIDLKDVYARGVVDGWYKLKALLGLKTRGEIHVVLQYTAIH